MQAITTKFLPATDRRGSRIKATCQRGSMLVEYDESLDVGQAHIAACRALRRKFAEEDAKQYGSPVDGNPWLRPMAYGSAKGQPGYTFVFVDSKDLI